ncbi:DUF6090 family protein [Nonlabens marinus]|uniref:Uncharacterized protein n=1 Tax=Nonlabens marinus S1-08 TaxID=1454201 RepID=W8VSB2_9FLAO|nr:DUF6090 family protein [Nonlabens marinus]BAO56774.1 hypothetical protein NMS_2765 [Nonlabens marinus S1-08]
MIKFFRKLRWSSLSRKRIPKYLLYATGEILLVVIGILIALQVNDWNENLKNDNKEQLILKDLHLEFQKNKEKLQSVIQHHQEIVDATTQVLNLVGQPEAAILQHNIDSLLYITIDHYDFSPNESAISELISSGKLNLITSDNLRLLIFEWVSAVEEKTEGYETMDEMSQTLTLPYITKNGSMKDIDQFGIVKIGHSKFEAVNYKLFKEREFENHMDNQVWGVTNYLLKLKRLEIIINDIVRFTNTETPTQK